MTLDHSRGNAHWLSKEEGSLKYIIQIQADSPEEAINIASLTPNHLWILCFLIK